MIRQYIMNISYLVLNMIPTSKNCGYWKKDSEFFISFLRASEILFKDDSQENELYDFLGVCTEKIFKKSSRLMRSST